MLGTNSPPLDGPPHVLRLITRLNIGGPARQALALTRELRDEFPTLLATGTAPAHEGELTDEAVDVIRLPLVRPLRPAADLAALRDARRLIARRGIGLVHTHMAKAGTIGRLAGFTSPARPKLVHTFHGNVLQGYFSPFQQRAFLEVERRLARRSDVLIAISPEGRDELLDLGVGKLDQYRVIPLGLDLDRHLALEGPSGLLRGHLGLPCETPLAGVLGRLVPIKDHGTLFAAVAQVPGLHLAVLGDGELRETLQGLTRSLGIADRVHFTGWWYDIPAALADLDVAVLSSRNEGTPVALIEALAAACPVVATDVGGVPHVVQQDETGWLCPPGDPSLLADLLRRTLDDPSAARRLAEEGRRRVAARFGQQRMVADHRDLYRELLGG